MALTVIDRLMIFNDQEPLSVAAAAVFKHRYDNANNLTLNLSGMAHAAIDTEISDRVTAVEEYDFIYIANPAMAGAVAGSIDTNQLTDMLALLKTGAEGTIVGTTITTPTTHTASTIGKTGLTWVIDEHAGRWVKLTAGTGSGQMAYIVSNTATVLTIAGTFTTTPDGTTEFEIWEDVGIVTLGLDTAGKRAPLRAWEAVYPLNAAIPQIVNWLGSDTYSYMYNSTATAAGAKTLTKTGAFTGLTLAGYTVALISATTGAYQKGVVASHTDDILTLEENWDFIPTGTIYFRLFKEDKEVLYDVYCRLYIAVKMYDLANSAVWDKWNNIIGMRGPDEVLKFKDLPPVQDELFLAEMVLEGKIMAEYALDADARYV